jgi:CubicO group peptidase (beta-lactamase class C family)
MRARHIIFAVLAVAAACALTAAYSVDWRMIQRVNDVKNHPEQVTKPEWYAPQILVAGSVAGPNAPLLAEAATSTRFAHADMLAETMNSDALLVSHKGVLVHEKYWNGTGQGSELLTYSFQKTMMGLLVGIGLEEGWISSLEDPVSRYIPEWDGQQKGDVTLRQVWQMSSGIERPRFDGSLHSPGNRFHFGSHLERETLAAELSLAPGSTFNYGSANAQLAGLILDRASPAGYPKLLSEKLWGPIGAGDAHLALDRAGGTPLTYCCLMATARDWLRVGELIRNRGLLDDRQVVPKTFFEEFERPADSNANYGLFVWLGTPFTASRRYSPDSELSVRSTSPFLASDVVFLDGAGAQRVYVSRNAELVIVRIGEQRWDWDESALFNSVAEALKPESDR